MLITWPGCRIEHIKMATGTMMCIYILLFVHFISTAEVSERRYQNNRNGAETDPVANFFSELGNLFLDIDETLAVQTAPKVEFEGIVAQFLRPPNEYFNDVQENYRSLQKRLGSYIRQSLTPKSIYTDRDLSTVGPPNHEESEKDSSTQMPLVKGDSFETTGEEKKGSSQLAASLDGMSESECSIEVLNNPFLEPDIRRACSQRFKRHVHEGDQLRKSMGRKGLESRRKNRLFIPPEGPDTYPHVFFRRGGDIAESTPKPQGRIIGDILYSESSFDSNLRQLLRDHGKWILDNPLLARWRKATAKGNSDLTTEASTTETEVTSESSSDQTPEMESTQAYIPVTPEYNTEIPLSEETYSENRRPLKSATYYRIMNNDGMTGEEVEVVLSPGSNLETVRIVETEREFKMPDSKESVILAFTQDGIPLKLRIGPEIENPSRFLHKILQSAGVSLNVPVGSYDGIEPVGKEVMKFGAGVLTRPAYYDLSNRDDLKTLLRTLMKSKASGKI